MFDLFTKYLKIIKKTIFETDYLLALVVVLSINTVALTIMAITALICTSFIIRSMTNLSFIIWNELTPGQQLIELSIIVTGVSLLISFFKAANELEEKINEAFEKLKKQNIEKDEKISDLKLELEKFHSFNV
jgi:flagellar biosynthesis protein FliP